jgi:hypothetical protein
MGRLVWEFIGVEPIIIVQQREFGIVIVVAFVISRRWQQRTA